MYGISKQEVQQNRFYLQLLSDFFCILGRSTARSSPKGAGTLLAHRLAEVPLTSKETIMKPISLILVLLLLAFHSPLALAQQSFNDWGVVQRIKTNERLLVKKKDGKEIKGRMIEATDTTLTLDRDGKPFNIARSDLSQVYIVEGKAQKGKWALIGAGIGAGAGAGIGATRYSRDRDDSEIWIPVGLIIGAGSGALGGMLFGQTNRERTLIYATN